MTASKANHYVNDFMIQIVQSGWKKSWAILVNTVPIKMLIGFLGLILEAPIRFR